MKSLFWEKIGSGHNNLILLHGWGLNSAIWAQIVPYLSTKFCLHLVDLPGYGRSYGYKATMSLEEIAEELVSKSPATAAIWLGWSFGGLIATIIACHWPHKVNSLITIASSPKFCSDENWPGIPSNILKEFSEKLCLNFFQTINYFFNLQTIGSVSLRKDIKLLKRAILLQTPPDMKVLLNGLFLLQNSDLRSILKMIEKPFLRMYGYLDRLVPYEAISLIDSMNLHSEKFVFPKSSHAPFISHPDFFCQELCKFIQKFSFY